MFDDLGLKSRPAFLPYSAGNETSRTFEAPQGAAAVAPETMGGGGGCCGPKKAATVGGGCC